MLFVSLSLLFTHGPEVSDPRAALVKPDGRKTDDHTRDGTFRRQSRQGEMENHAHDNGYNGAISIRQARNFKGLCQTERRAC